MRKLCYILILFATIIPLGCKKVNNDCNIDQYTNAPQKSWMQEISGSEEESHGHYILTCSDGGFLQIGETGFIPHSAKILAVKTDDSGQLVWKKEFGMSGHNLGNSVIETLDAYIICGAMNGNSTIIKLNKTDGNQQFIQSIDNGGNDAFEHLVATSYGFLAVGYNNAEDTTNTFFTQGNGYITFLDSNGNKINGININNYLAHAYRVVFYNNHYYISGLTENANNYGLLKTDRLGNIIWDRVYGGDSADHCFGMDLGENGSIFLTGHTLSGTENWDTYTLKIDSNGYIVWDQIRGNPRGFDPKYIHDEAWDVKSTVDGGCIVVAGTGDEYNRYNRRCGSEGDQSSTWHIYLIKYDRDGNLEWQKTYGGENNMDWAGEAIDLTSDGGAIIALDNGQFGFVKIQGL